MVNAYARTRGTAVAVLDEEDEAVKEVEQAEGPEQWGDKDDGNSSDEEGVRDGMDTLVDEGGDDIPEVLVKIWKRRPGTDKQAGRKKRRVE